MGLFDAFHNEKIFPVNMTGPDSFELDGEEYQGKPHCAGREFAPGEKAHIAFTANTNPFGGPVGRRMPVIFAGATRRSWMVEGPSAGGTLLAGLWAQALSSGGLNPLALACFRPDPTASTLTAWSGIGGHYNDYPVLLDKDARPVLCFAERKIDNSNWDKMRVLIATGTDTELAYECDWTGADTSFLAGFNATSADGNLVYLSEANSRRAWRKRGEALEEITLIGLSSNHGYDASNMSDGGRLIFPRYYKHYTGHVNYAEYAGGEPPPSPTITWTSDDVLIERFDLDIEDATVAKADIDPASFFEYDHPGLMDFSGSHAFDSQGRILAWASARDSFDPSEVGFDAAACVGWERNNYQLPRAPGGDFIYPNHATTFGRKIAGALACIGSSGTIWVHKIEKTAGDPLSNSQLIDPFESIFATQTEDNSYTDANAVSAVNYPANDLRPEPHVPFSSIEWGGLAAPGALNSSQRRILSHEVGSLYFGPYYLYYNTGEYTGFPPYDDPYAVTGHQVSGGNFALPRYDHYNAVGIELLPRGRNLTKATKLTSDDSKRENWDVFSSWAGPTSQSGSSVVVKRPEDAAYLCYTVPRSCFFGGFSTLQGHVSDAGHGAPYAFAQEIQASWNSYYRIDRAEEDGGPYTLTVDPFTYPLWSSIGSGGYGLGSAAFINADQIAVTGHYVRGLSYLSERYLRKVDSEGALVWETDLTQLVAGAECWRSRTEMGVRPPGDELIGGVTTEELPLGDDMGPARAAGRVVLLPCDFHELGPNFLPTQRLLVFDDSNGSLLHTLPLTDAGGGIDPDETLAEDIRGPGDPITSSDSASGDGVTTEFFLSQAAQSIVYAEVDGELVEATLGEDGESIIFTEAPADGIVWYVEYVTGYTEGELIWEAGEKRFDTTVSRIHCGVDPNSKEWALVALHTEDRLPGEDSQTGDRTMRLKMGTSISVAPDCDWIFETLSLRNAIHGGSIYRLGSNGAGTANSILRKTNPSTT